MTTPPRIPGDDDLLLRVGPFGDIDKPPSRPFRPAPTGRESAFDIAGWSAVRVGRSCETYPSVFEVALTERFPGDNRDVPLRPGDPCQVLFTRGYDLDVVITGYIDRVIAGYSGNRHSLTVVGRSKCADLVDCSAIAPRTGQFNNARGLDIAQALAAPYGIAVTQLGDPGKPIPMLVFMWGESPAEIVDRVARFLGVLVYDVPSGDLVLADVGASRMSSGFAEGQNIEGAAITYSMDARFSEYRVRRLTFDPVRSGGADPEGDMIAVVRDDGVRRPRVKYIIGEMPWGLGEDFAKARGEWEAARRFGRSSQINLTTDSWRDSAGKLWAPNSVVPVVDLPTLKRPSTTDQTWIISSVVFRRDERGTHADIVLLPQSAFEMLPVPLTQPLNAGPLSP